MNSIRQNDKNNFTFLKNYLIDNRITEDAVELAKFRGFDENSLSNRGIFYSENPVDTIKKYEFLKSTSIIFNKNPLYSGYYIYPICNTKGEVLLHMGYNPYPQGRELRYEISNVIGVNQRNLIANLESLSLYDGELIYVVEGYFDSIALNELYKVKSIACLGSSNPTNAKKAILFKLKELGHKLVYIPDNDEAGKNPINNPIWDYIIPIPNPNIKDMNEYLIEYKNKKVELFNIHPKSNIFTYSNSIQGLNTGFGFK